MTGNPEPTIEPKAGADCRPGHRGLRLACRTRHRTSPGDSCLAPLLATVGRCPARLGMATVKTPPPILGRPTPMASSGAPLRIDTRATMDTIARIARQRVLIATIADAITAAPVGKSLRVAIGCGRPRRGRVPEPTNPR